MKGKPHDCRAERSVHAACGARGMACSGSRVDRSETSALPSNHGESLRRVPCRPWILAPAMDPEDTSGTMAASCHYCVYCDAIGRKGAQLLVQSQERADECRLHDVRFTSVTKTGCKRPPRSRWHAAGLTFACQSWAPPKRKEENNKLWLPPLSSCPRSCRTQRPPNCPTRRFA